MALHFPETPTFRRPEPEPSRALLYVLLLVTGLGIGVLGFWLGGLILPKPQTNPNPPPLTDPHAQLREAAANGPLDAEEAEANNLFETCKDSVVNVDTVVRQRDPSDNTLY